MGVAEGVFHSRGGAVSRLDDRLPHVPVMVTMRVGKRAGLHAKAIFEQPLARLELPHYRGPGKQIQLRVGVRVPSDLHSRSPASASWSQVSMPGLPICPVVA